MFLLFQYEISLIYVLSHRFQFGKLGEMIAARSRLKEHSRFLFVPGPDDAGTPNLVMLLADSCSHPHVQCNPISKFVISSLFKMELVMAINLVHSFIS